MKKFLLVVIIVSCVCSVSNAQLQQGNILVGSEISNVNFTLNEGKNYSVTLTPKAAFFLRDNLAIGPYVFFGISGAKDAGTSVGYGLGGFGRYYFSKDQVNLVRSMRFFTEANAGIEGYNPSVGENTNGLGLGVGPGLTYFLTSNVGIEALLKYNVIVGFGSTPATSQLNLGIGFQIYLPGKKVQEKIKADINAK